MTTAPPEKDQPETDQPETLVITLPSGTKLTIHDGGRVEVEGPLDEDVIAIIHSLDPDAEIVCRPPPAEPAA
jgi:hypothetical protein